MAWAAITRERADDGARYRTYPACKKRATSRLPSMREERRAGEDDDDDDAACSALAGRPRADHCRTILGREPRASPPPIGPRRRSAQRDRKQAGHDRRRRRADHSSGRRDERHAHPIR